MHILRPPLGRGDGADLSRRLQELGLDTPILYMSGYTRDEVLDRRLIQRDAAFLQKPFTADDLASAVQGLLTRPEAETAPGERPGGPVRRGQACRVRLSLGTPTASTEPPCRPRS